MPFFPLQCHMDRPEVKTRSEMKIRHETKIMPEMKTGPEIKIRLEIKTRSEMKIRPEMKIMPEMKTKPEMKTRTPRRQARDLGCQPLGIAGSNWAYCIRPRTWVPNTRIRPFETSSWQLLSLAVTFKRDPVCHISTLWCNSPTRATTTSILRFLNHIQQHATLGKNPLNGASALRMDLYLTTQNIRKRHTFMHPAGFETTIRAGGRPQNLALNRSSIEIHSYLL